MNKGTVAAALDTWVITFHLSGFAVIEELRLFLRINPICS